MVYITNYTNGYIVEYSAPCFDSWLLIPGENLWRAGLRGFLYTLAMFYLFLGIAIVADIFMGSIEVITSKKRKLTRFDPEKQESVEIEVFVWNETVANLTLMALGSSAPEILLAVIETIQDISSDGAQGADQDGLGTFTIIGSASFNMLLITAICVVSVPTDTVKRVREFGVFIWTAVWSLFAYVWLLITLKWVSPDEVEIWEAFLTLSFFPLLVFTSWCQDHGWWCSRRTGKVLTVETPEVRVVGLTERRQSHLMIHRSMELRVLEQQRHSVSERDLRDLPRSRDKLKEVVSLWKLRGQKPDANSNETAESLAHALKHIKEVNTQPQNTTTARLRFRHAALHSITRSKARKIKEKEESESQKAMNVLAKSFIGSKLTGTSTLDEATQKFNFSTQSYSVLKSAKHVDVDILLLSNNKRRPSRVSSHKALIPLPSPYDPATQIDEGKCAKMNSGHGNMITVNGISASPINKPAPSPKEQLYTRPDSPSDTISERSENDENNHRDSVCSLAVGTMFSVDYETRDGSAKHGKDYTSVKGTMNFQLGTSKHILRIPIIQHDDYKNKEFFVILKKPTPASIVDLGEPSLTKVTIIDDDEPGEFSFEQASYHANFMTEDVTCTVVRRRGCDGCVTVNYHTLNGTATGGTEEQIERKECDFEAVSDGVLTFQHGETSKMIEIRINPECQNKNFIVLLHDPSPGARIGEKSATVAHVSSDVDDIVDRVANIITSEDEQSLTKSWRSQFEDAIVIQGEEDDDGNIQPLTTMDFILHLLTIFWKVLFAFIPPRNVLGGWAAFVFSLGFIAILTAIVEQLGKLLGCVVGLKNSVTGITIIAIGTSLPDTFASKTAALQDSGADAAIGNITGSNSVNVFLGLGLPWVISVCYHAAMGTKFRVSSGNLSFSVLVYTSCGACCLVILVLRRVFLGGELGGSLLTKWSTGLFLVFLWLLYTVLSSLMAYGYIPGTI